ncbi:tRNA guanosine(34) transglycosylase Tgt [bacterium]|nr:tRNA guanosine(34) transglycosylase Tgt [bacterium]
MRFELQATDPGSKARAGIISTDHGDILTPVFMPVGTQGTVKTVHQRELRDEVEAPIILGNTYHLYLRPGMEILRAAGGLHRFMGWDRPMLTDSGGYQIFSLSEQRKLSEEGARFKSHIDGSMHFFSPESVVDIQRIIGADFIMAFDECPPYPAEQAYVAKSMELTHRWLDRCWMRMEETEPLYGHAQSLFPICQGGIYPDLRMRSAEYIAAKGADGNAIGGLSVGEPAEEMYGMVDTVCSILPTDRPRYLMGVGTPVNLLENMALGIDMFDCVMPSRNARNGMLFTFEGIINIRNAVWANDFGPLDPYGTSFVDSSYSKAYVRHLFVSNEYLGKQIATLHNLTFYVELMRQAREHILDGSFTDWKNALIPKLEHRLGA